MALAEIPDRIEKLCGYTNDIHRGATRLHECADLVYVEILEVLEHVIKELAANPFSRSLIKPPLVASIAANGPDAERVWRATARQSSYPASIKKAVENMEKKMMSFKEEVDLLDSRNLARCSSRLDEMEKNRALEQRRFSVDQKMVYTSKPCLVAQGTRYRQVLRKWQRFPLSETTYESWTVA